MKKTLLALAAVVAAAAPAHAQLPNLTPFSFEVRGGLASPSGDFGETGGSIDDILIGLETGYTVGVSATYHINPLLGIYGGYAYSRFSVEAGETDMVDRGFNAGVRVAIPTPLIPIDPYVRAGLVYNTVGYELDIDEMHFDHYSDRSVGFEVGAGIGIGLGPKLSFTPQLTYTRYAPRYDDGDAGFDVEHLRADVGLRLRL